MPVLESRLVIAGQDDTGAMFASVEARIAKLQGSVEAINSQVNAVRGPAAAVGATAAPPAAVQAQTRAVEDANRKPTPVGGAGVMESIAGFAAMITGFTAIAGGWKQSVDQAHERMRQQLAAMSPEEIAEGEKIGADIASRYPSVAQSDIMHTLRTARTVTGSYDEARGQIGRAHV